MDSDNDPLYNRRLRGTPSHRFANKWAAIIVGFSILCGFGIDFLIRYLPQHKKEEPTLMDIINEKMDNHRNHLRATLMAGPMYSNQSNPKTPDSDEVEK